MPGRAKSCDYQRRSLSPTNWGQVSSFANYPSLWITELPGTGQLASRHGPRLPGCPGWHSGPPCHIPRGLGHGGLVGPVRLHCTDTSGDWIFGFREGQYTVSNEPDSAGVTLSGTASDLAPLSTTALPPDPLRWLVPRCCWSGGIEPSVCSASYPQKSKLAKEET